MVKQERENRAHAGRGKRGKNRNRMDVTFIQNTENDVNGQERRENQQRLIRERPEKCRSRALERGLQAWRHIQFLLHTVDGVDGVAQGRARREVEGNGDDRKLALMVQRERRAGRV